MAAFLLHHSLTTRPNTDSSSHFMDYFEGIVSHATKILHEVQSGQLRGLYRDLFSTKQFPFWFSIRALWCIYVVHRSNVGPRRSFGRKFMNVIVQFVVSSMMTFLPREAIAYIFKRQSPILANTECIPLYLSLFLIVNVSPFDIVFKVLNAFYFVLGLLQGVNQAKLFTMIIKWLAHLTKSNSAFQFITFAVGFTVMDQFIEMISRFLTKARETPMCNFSSVLKTTFMCSFYWMITHRNRFTQYIGLYPEMQAQIMLALGIGIMNATCQIFARAIERSPRSQGQNEVPRYQSNAGGSSNSVNHSETYSYGDTTHSSRSSTHSNNYTPPPPDPKIIDLVDIDIQTESLGVEELEKMLAKAKSNKH